MSHYYINDKSLKENKKTIFYELNNIRIKLVTDSGVFSRNYVDFGSGLLLKNINKKAPKVIIDMGCGYGILGIYLSKKYPDSKVFLYDVNEKAVELSRNNAQINEALNLRVEVSNLYDKVTKKCDLIVSNPPVRAGKQVIFDVYKGAAEHLKKTGELVIVLQKKQGALSSFKFLEEIFEEVKLLDREKGYHIISAKRAKNIDILWTIW